MELMNLVAKMTLDASEYDRQLAALVSNPPPEVPEIKVIPIWDEEGLRNFVEGTKQNKDLTVKPTLETDEYKDKLKEAEGETNWFRDVMTGVWQGLKDALVAVGITGVISGVINYMRQGITLAAKNGDAIEKGAKNLQLSTKAYQEYEYALGKSNLRITDLTKAMSTFDQIRGGSATKAQVEYLGKLGINAEQATSGLMSAEQMLDAVMSSLADYKGADKGAIIDAFFGKSANWTGYFDKTSKEIDDLKKEAEELGLVMSDESIKNAVAYQDATEKLGNRLEAIQRSFGEGILPLITEAVNKLMLIVDFFTGSDTRTSSEKFTDLDRKFESQINDITAKGITAKTLAQTLMNMGDTSGMDATQLAIWKGTAESLINMIPTLSGVIDTENGTISETTDGINDLIEAYIKLEKETAYQTSKAERQNVLDQKQNKLTEEAVTANEKLAEAEGKRNDAIDAYNAVLKKYDKNAETVGYDATLQDLQDAQDKLLLSMSGDEYGLAQATLELQNARKPLTELLGEAQRAQAEVDKLTADIKQGTEDFEAWQAAHGNADAAISETAQQAAADVQAVNQQLGDIPSDVYSTIHILTDGEKPEGFAKGNMNVPYDMPAYLHRGEMVLTKSQARKYRDGGGDGSGAIVSAIQSMRSDLQNMKLVVGQRIFGKTVVDYGGNRMNGYIGEAENRAAAGYGT